MCLRQVPQDGDHEVNVTHVNNNTQLQGIEAFFNFKNLFIKGVGFGGANT